MLQLQPDKTITIEQIREEIAAQLQKLDYFNLRVVSGFVEKLVEHNERANEMHGAS